MSLMRLAVSCGFGLIMTVLHPLVATAEESLTPLAASGDWIAAAHHPSSLAAPDVCVAAVKSARILLRADENDIEFRVANDDWSLPVGVKGQITVNIAGKETVLDIVGNNATSVGAEISREAAIDLLDSMSKSLLMTVKAGKDKPLNVSLSGSNKALSAF